MGRGRPEHVLGMVCWWYADSRHGFGRKLKISRSQGWLVAHIVGSNLTPDRERPFRMGGYSRDMSELDGKSQWTEGVWVRQTGTDG